MPPQWQRVKEIFNEVIRLKPDEREGFLDQVCADDEFLRREVSSLLSSHNDDSFLEQPAIGEVADVILEENAQLAKGKRINQYEIIQQIGAGGMGEVYLARDTKLGRKVALKVLPSNFTGDADRLRRFEQEACAASSLNHPNILTIYEIGKASRTHYIAAEFIEGETLRERMTGAPMKTGEVLNIAEQIASALAAAHEAGIIHRDIKPENVMVRRDALVKVLDFGLAKLTKQLTAELESATPALVKTSSGVVMGTMTYMSPEQARGLAVDARTDVWSLGVVLYEMVAGRPPFKGATPSDVLSLILQKEPPPLRRYSPEAPAELDRIVTKALRKDCEERYQVVKDLALDLKSLKQHLAFEVELERSASPEKDNEARRLATRGGHLGAGTEVAAAQTVAGSIHTTSSAENIVGEIKRHRLAALLILAMLAVAIIAVAYFVIPSSVVRSDNAGVPAPSASGTIRSIAVLPFTNTSGNPDTEYLSDGISESLINSLSQLPGMKVIARSSSFKYKGQEVDPEEVANALGVEGILTGRIAQRGEHLMISVELVNAREKTHVWGEQYNRRTSDVLAVLSEISREMAEKLRLRLTPGEQLRLARRETANPQAYELMLKGLFHRRKGGIQDAKKSIEYYKQAIAIDPNYALAYARLAGNYNFLVSWSVGEPNEFTPKAEAAARRALELDESLTDAHVSLASIKENGWDWAGAEREYQRGIELNPNLARARILYARYLSFVGRHEQAIAEAKRARELDPLSPLINANANVILIFARNYDQAMEALKKTLELDEYRFTLEVFGYTYAAKGMYVEAIAAYQQAIKVGGDTPSTQVRLGTAYAGAGALRRAQAILKRLETSKEYVSPAELAILYAALGQREQAFASLERAYTAHDPQLKSLAVDPAFDPLRPDPRFTDLLRRVGLPQMKLQS